MNYKMEGTPNFKKGYKGHFEMNIRFTTESDDSPLDDMPLRLLEDPLTIERAKEAVMGAILDGYTHIVYNFVRSGHS